MKVIFDKPRSRTAQILVALAVLVVVTVGLLEKFGGDSRTNTATESDPTKNQVVVEGGSASVVPARPPSKSTGPVAVFSAEDRAATVNRLMASAIPADAFRAFQVINACLHARTYEVAQAQKTADPLVSALVPRASDACAGLEPGQLAARVRLLVQAGEAGVPGAYQEAVGLLYSELKADQELRQAMPIIQAAAIERGDTGAIGARIGEILSVCQSRCSDAQLAEAIKLQTAFGLIMKAEKRDLGLPDTVTPRLLESAPPDLAERASQAGKEFALATRGHQ